MLDRIVKWWNRGYKCKFCSHRYGWELKEGFPFKYRKCIDCGCLQRFDYMDYCVPWWGDDPRCYYEKPDERLLDYGWFHDDKKGWWHSSGWYGNKRPKKIIPDENPYCRDAINAEKSRQHWIDQKEKNRCKECGHVR